MIKKFEEFVNEDYDSRIFNVHTMFDYLEELGVSKRDILVIHNMGKKRGFYSAEEIDNILKRLPNCDTIKNIADALKTVFYGSKEDLKQWVGDVKCPVVVGEEGLLICGEVYYFKQFDIYTDDDWDYFYNYICKYIEENDEIDNSVMEEWEDDYDYYDFFEKLIDDGVIVKVDLDKEFGWEDDGSWEEKWKTSKILNHL